MSMSVNVYVASPYAEHARVRGVHQKLAAAGIVPTSRWADEAENDGSIGAEWDAAKAFTIDRDDIARSDIMLALIDIAGGRETFAEIEVARSCMMPVVYVGKPHMSLEHYTSLGLGFQCPDVDSAVQTVSVLSRTESAQQGVALMRRALDAVLAERARQNRKWGRKPGAWGNVDLGTRLGILGEEFGEVCKAVIEHAYAEELRAELVQVAAVATCWIECIDAGERL